MKKSLRILFLLVAVSWPGRSFADPMRMALQPNGKGSFTLTGERVVGVRSFDVEIDYDPNLLEKPYAMIVGGELKQVAADTPGKLLISVFRPAAEALLQIILKFETRADEAGGIQHIALSSITRRSPNQPPESYPDSSSDNAGGEPADGPADVSSMIIKAGDTAPQRNTAAPDRSAPSAMSGSSYAVNAGNNSHSTELTALLRDENCVLQRFRKFKGENGLKAFTALFAWSDENRIAQEPMVVLSDGITPVSLRMNLRQKATNSPEVALFDAKLVSVIKADETTLVITVLPSKGTWDAGLVLSTGKEMIEFPLVVAPPVTIEGGINENNFLAALDKYISGQAPARQAENKAYLYQYIFTANYLAAAAAVR